MNNVVQACVYAYGVYSVWTYPLQARAGSVLGTDPKG